MFTLPDPPSVVAEALDAAANATLTFKVPTTGTTTDAYSNPVPNTTTIQFSANVTPKAKETVNTTTRLEGVDQKWLECDVYLVSPKTIQGTGVGNQTTGSILFTDGTAGKIRLKTDIQSPFPGVRDVIGDRFIAFLLMDNAK